MHWDTMIGLFGTPKTLNYLQYTSVEHRELGIVICEPPSNFNLKGLFVLELEVFFDTGEHYGFLETGLSVSTQVIHVAEYVGVESILIYEYDVVFLIVAHGRAIDQHATKGLVVFVNIQRYCDTFFTQTHIFFFQFV